MNENAENFDADAEAAALETDFDLEDEYKPTPLIPNGKYTGSITKSIYTVGCLRLYVTLAGNDGFMSDGEPAIDGAQEIFNIWLPKKGDESELTKSGKQTKRQWKINNAKKQGDALGINLNNLQAIKDGAESGDWVGIEVTVEIQSGEFNGEARNEINRIAKM